MNDFLEHLGNDLQEIGAKLKNGVNKILGKPTTATGGSSVVTSTVKLNYEINLVPEVKAQMIKAQKMRNLVLFLCIVVSSAAVGAVVLLFGVKSGQDIAIASQDGKLEIMSNKLHAYSELDSLITIQNQLTGIEEITDQKTVLARVFGALGVMLPQGADSVKLSELSVNMENNTIRMEGQADARIDPLIDYRVLESFKKSVALTKYDYGRYVDADGTEIPTYCISETDAEGNPYKTGDSFYAWWDLTIEGCEGAQRGGTPVDDAKFYYTSTADVVDGIIDKDGEVISCEDDEEKCKELLAKAEEEEKAENGESGENGEGQNDQNRNEGQNGNGLNGGLGDLNGNDLGNNGLGDTNIVTDQETKKVEMVPIKVKIWRTPQFTDWYEAGKLSLDGSIANVEHFVSSCITYNGVMANDSPRWTSTNDCMLAPEGLEITSSSNGRDESENLVLKFSGTTVLSESFFKFTNKHMIAIGPLGQNVTDSYVQIGNMFTQEATECEPDDVECLNNNSNRGGN